MPVSWFLYYTIRYIRCYHCKKLDEGCIELLCSIFQLPGSIISKLSFQKIKGVWFSLAGVRASSLRICWETTKKRLNELCPSCLMYVSPRHGQPFGHSELRGLKMKNNIPFPKKRSFYLKLWDQNCIFCVCLKLGSPEADPDTGMWMHVVCVRHRPRKHQWRIRGREEANAGYIIEQVTILGYWSTVTLGNSVRSLTCIRVT